MKQIFKLVILFIFFGIFSAKADLYTATDVEMLGEGTNPVEAKNNAITSGELKAFDQMIINLVGANNEAFVERPEDNEILEMVRDISILEEKNTSTAYWGKMDVRFKKADVQNYLQSKKQPFVKQAPPTYWVIPVWTQGAKRWALEDENQFYQILKSQDNLSSFFKMILPVGDLHEMVAVTKALEKEDVSSLQSLAKQNGAEEILMVEVRFSYNGNWAMMPMTVEGAEDRFSDMIVLGQEAGSIENAWQQLVNRMANRWQYQNMTAQSKPAVHYARLNVDRLAEWGQLEKVFQKMKFLENLSVQGVMPGQILLSFSYTNQDEDLSEQFEENGWIWMPDSSGTVGALKRKDNNENTL